MDTRTFRLGFSTLEHEIALDKLPISGNFPEWLTGCLLRNGPAKFEAGNKSLRHWFDGLAMIHQFSFHHGTISYTNKFLESNAYRYIKKNHSIGYSEFATDPCRTIFQRLMHIFHPQTTDNCNVNISRVDNTWVALTETMTQLEFDDTNLKTIGPFQYNNKLDGVLTTAHPHYDFDRQEEINFQTQFGSKSSYQIYSIAQNSRVKNLIGTIPTDLPSYIHSFALSKNYIILVEYPYVVNPLNLLLSNKPFIENFKWQPERGTKFSLLDRTTGILKGSYHTDAFFAFHHINAFEDNDKLIIDISAYPDPQIIQSLYLEVLRGTLDKPMIAAGEFRRYSISLKDSLVSYDIMSEHPIDLPRINYESKNMKNYRFVYGVGTDKNNSDNFFDRLLKVDLENRSTKLWQADQCYPGEPVFVSSPHSSTEDDGIILSVVLNTEKNNSFLLALDASSFEEIARAEVPHHIPFGFHGVYY